MSEKARREGILSIEDDIPENKDFIIRQGIKLIVDGTDPDWTSSILKEMSMREYEAAEVYYSIILFGILFIQLGLAKENVKSFLSLCIPFDSEYCSEEKIESDFHNTLETFKIFRKNRDYLKLPENLRSSGMISLFADDPYTFFKAIAQIRSSISSFFAYCHLLPDNGEVINHAYSYYTEKINTLRNRVKNLYDKNIEESEESKRNILINNLLYMQ